MSKKKDLTKKKISAGIACLPCSVDHFMSFSGFIDEASRMSKPIDDNETLKRLGLARRELNTMERVDLTDSAIKKMNKKEQRLARYVKKKSAELRHMMTPRNLKGISDLNDLSAKATDIYNDVWARAWKLAKGPVSCPVKKPVRKLDFDVNGCKQGKVRNPKTKRCIKACKTGFKRKIATGRCIKI